MKLICGLCSPKTRRGGTTGNGKDYDVSVNDNVDNDDDGDNEMHARGIRVERPRTTLRETPKAPGQQPLGGIRSTMPTTRNYTARVGTIAA
ncbi:unnamed protein product [Lasius platythorax]|uniref:Uncharacterized protein n=1 Tax=Lasius platythorax TaxID=488582 RepID=A0AAV2P786_9HYME